MGISTLVGECPFPLPPSDNVAYCYSLYREEWAELQLSQQHALVIRMESTSYSCALASARSEPPIFFYIFALRQLKFYSKKKMAVWCNYCERRMNYR